MYLNIANNLTLYCLDPVQRSERQREKINNAQTNYAQFEDVPDEIYHVPGPLLSQEDKPGDNDYNDTDHQDDQASEISDKVNICASSFKLLTVCPQLLSSMFIKCCIIITMIPLSLGRQAAMSYHYFPFRATY